MPRPTVLIATTDHAMAYALHARLGRTCLELGLRLEVCPGGVPGEKLEVHAYGCAEALFDELEMRSREDALSMADTLVVLDVGANLEEAFQPKVSKQENWYVTGNRSGVALELILRFPQVFPVILSPEVPTMEQRGGKDVIEPHYPPDTGENRFWPSFCKLREELCAANKPTADSEEKNKSVADSEKQHQALQVPLHLVSPLDRGAGLVSTLTRFAHGMRCWFDPTGLRTLVRNRFLGTVFGSESDWSNTKSQREELWTRLERCAVAVDEEREFAALNAYAAYKFGRRGWMVTTYKEFKDHPLWVAKSENDESDTVVLRDVDLRFPDVPDNNSGWREKAKDITSEEVWKGKYGKWTVRVVSGEDGICIVGERCEELFKNDIHKRGQLEDAKDLKYLGWKKPVGSLYELTKVLGVKGEPAERSVLAGLDPVGSSSNQKNAEGNGGHGAPYLNLAMAESLLGQARRCRSKHSPTKNLVGALLASEAYELLLGMSKTTALEALSEMHKAEVRAEVCFEGVAGSIRYMKYRQKDVEETLEKLYAGGDSRLVQASYLSQFWSSLRLIYQNADHFDEAEEANIQHHISGAKSSGSCPDKLRRHAHEMLKRPADALRCIFDRRWTREWLVRSATSVKWWSMTYLGSQILFTVVWAWFKGWNWDPGAQGISAFLGLFLDVVRTSFAMDVVEHGQLLFGEADSLSWKILMVAHLSFAYVMFALLVAMIFRKITRS